MSAGICGDKYHYECKSLSFKELKTKKTSVYQNLEVRFLAKELKPIEAAELAAKVELTRSRYTFHSSLPTEKSSKILLENDALKIRKRAALLTFWSSRSKTEQLYNPASKIVLFEDTLEFDWVLKQKTAPTDAELESTASFRTDSSSSDSNRSSPISIVSVDSNPST